MSWVTELIQAIPDIVIYIAPGFLFVSVFMWVTHRKFHTPQVQVVAGIVASFVLKSCFDGIITLFAWQVTSPWDAILLCAVSGILGILLGIASASPWLTNLLIFCHIYRSGNSSVWDDVLRGNMWMAVYDDQRRLYYCGQVRHTSEDEKQLLIALAGYYIMDADQNVLEWHLGTEDYIMIDTSQYRSIQIAKTDPYAKTEPA